MTTLALSTSYWPADTSVELTAWCRERMAPYKVPVRVEVVDTYPMTPSGKVQKFRLRELLAGS